MSKRPEELTLGNYLQKCRRRAGLTLQQVADAIKCPGTQFVWNIENEVSLIPIKYILPLARVYKVSDLELRTECANYQIRKIKRKWGIR